MSQVLTPSGPYSSSRLYVSALPIPSYHEVPVPGNPTISNIVVDKNGLAWFTCESLTLNRIGTWNVVTDVVNLYVLDNPGDKFGGLWIGPDQNGVPNNAVWIGNSQQNSIHIIDLATAALATGSNAIVQQTFTFSAGTTNQPGGIAQHSDGSMWVCRGNLSVMTAMTYTVGSGWSTHDWPTNTGAATPHGNHLGSDGRMWVCLFAVGRIAAFTTAGVCTEYPLPSGTGGQPYWVIDGNDGFMYFTEITGNRVGRVNILTGQVQEFSTGITAASSPGGIWPSPAGDILFTEKTNNSIARFSRQTLTTTNEYALLTAASNPDKVMYHPGIKKLIGTEHDAGQLFTMQP